MIAVVDPDPRAAVALLARWGVAPDGGRSIRWVHRAADVAALPYGTAVLFGDDRHWPVHGPAAGLMAAVLARIKAGAIRPVTVDDFDKTRASADYAAHAQFAGRAAWASMR